ncbi:hypothetical protein [Formosa sp. PL04]|uniref:hypothetical protein n=1 Tax=Formosa sp. PL04 TaxID=3081755 RepID=UPI002982832E|nr:hypothetical protein [Formosa sp. PL04]MDW5289020.1 hypothetical protein [Formosa sp. PL04]
MKVSESQIQELFLFTRQHFVEYFDVQTELVDHLANDIEFQREDTPDRTFEDALTIAFKKFGIFGFQDVVEARIKALNKHYWSSVWTIFKQFFTLPKIISTAALFCVTYLIFKYTPFFNYTLAAIFSGLIVVFFVKVFRLNKAVKQQRKKTGRKWMYEDVFMQLGGLLGALGVFVQFLFRILDIQNSFEGYKLIILSATIVGVGILIYITLFVVPKKITLYLKQQYKAYYV